MSLDIKYSNFFQAIIQTFRIALTFARQVNKQYAAFIP